jgi:polyisoprenoid-binding protein YceI
MKTAALILFAALLGAAAPSARAEQYAIDLPHTQVIFSINHLGFSNSSGFFSVKEGSFHFVEGDWSKASVDVTLDVGSLNMGDKTWNEHMRDAKFFNSVKFPTMRFVSSSATGSGANGVVKGTLTMLGVSKPLTLNVTRNKIGKHPMANKDYAGFSATATLKRSDWGMVAYAGAIGDEVSIRIEAEGAKK